MPASDVTRLLYRVVFDTSWIFANRQLNTGKVLSYQVLLHSTIGKKDDVIEISTRGDLPHQVVQEAEVERDNGDGPGSCTNGFISRKLRQIKNSNLFLMWLERLKNDQ